MDKSVETRLWKTEIIRSVRDTTLEWLNLETTYLMDVKGSESYTKMMDWASLVVQEVSMYKSL